MALSDPVDTLAYHASRILCQKRDMSEVSCKSVASAMTVFMNADKASGTVPESEGLWFYGMNHGMALIGAARAPLEPLDAWEKSFAELYHKQMGPKAIRAFYYLIWICTREARHCTNFSVMLPKIGKEFGDEMQTFFTSAGGEDGISKRFLNKPPNASIGTYCKAVAWLFYHGSWHGGYGGKKWGVVTDCLVRFVTGEYSAEMMLDTVWTLAHNGGPIFNKGKLYACYSHTLYRVLDVQRSGQIPEAVLFDDAVKQHADPDLMGLMKQVKDRYPEVGDSVDWVKVEALGSVHKYPKEIQKQLASKPLTPAQKKAKEAAEAAAIAKAKAEKEAAEKEALEHALYWFQVMPGVEVKKFQPARAA